MKIICRIGYDRFITPQCVVVNSPEERKKKIGGLHERPPICYMVFLTYYVTLSGRDPQPRVHSSISPHMIPMASLCALLFIAPI